MTTPPPVDRVLVRAFPPLLWRAPPSDLFDPLRFSWRPAPKQIRELSRFLGARKRTPPPPFSHSDSVPPPTLFFSFFARRRISPVIQTACSELIPPILRRPPTTFPPDRTADPRDLSSRSSTAFLLEKRPNDAPSSKRLFSSFFFY